MLRVVMVTQPFMCRIVLQEGRAKMQNWKLVVKADGKTMYVRIQAQYGEKNVKSLPIKD